MKKLFIIPVVFLFFIASAVALPQYSLFSGRVYDVNNIEIGYAGVEVQVMCDNGPELTSLGTTTSLDGGVFILPVMNLLKLKHPDAVCREGDLVYAKVNGQQSNVAAVIIDAQSGLGGANSQLFVGVPEFSTATLALAIVGVTLGVVALRRKQ